MEVIIAVVILLVVVAFVLGRARDSRLAERIGHEVNAQAPSDDPVILLERLNRLREAGALTEIEYQEQKARILDGSDGLA